MGRLPPRSLGWPDFAAPSASSCSALPPPACGRLAAPSPCGLPPLPPVLDSSSRPYRLGPRGGRAPPLPQPVEGGGAGTACSSYTARRRCLPEMGSLWLWLLVSPSVNSSQTDCEIATIFEAESEFWSGAPRVLSAPRRGYSLRGHTGVCAGARRSGRRRPYRPGAVAGPYLTVAPRAGRCLGQQSKKPTTDDSRSAD
jgi:hypothetical protein